MRFIALITAIIIVLIAFSGCIGNSDDLKNNQPQNGTGDYINSSSDNSTVEITQKNDSKFDATGVCSHVVDGDTIDVKGIGRIRFVGVNTPERGEAGFEESKNFVKSMCLGKTVSLDIDDKKHYDKYDRILAVVYVNNVNLNAELIKKGYAEIMYIPPSEFNPYSWT